MATSLHTISLGTCLPAYQLGQCLPMALILRRITFLEEGKVHFPPSPNKPPPSKSRHRIQRPCSHVPFPFISLQPSIQNVFPSTFQPCRSSLSTAMTPALALPTLRVHAKKADLELTATPSICVDVPNDLPSITTIDELAVVVKNAHIWIARTGTCCIEISIAVNGRPILENEHLQKTIDLIQYCPVWLAPCTTAPIGLSCLLGLESPGASA